MVLYTNLLVFQVKICTTKCFFTLLYRNPSVDNNSAYTVNEFTTEFSKTLDNIEGKIHTSILSLVIQLAKNRSRWDDVSDYSEVSIVNITSCHGLHEIINQPTCIDLISVLIQI